jgi:hypothetical protein
MLWQIVEWFLWGFFMGAGWWASNRILSRVIG